MEGGERWVNIQTLVEWFFMKNWERIRQARPDITDYVIHWVRAETEEEIYIMCLKGGK